MAAERLIRRHRVIPRVFLAFYFYIVVDIINHLLSAPELTMAGSTALSGTLATLTGMAAFYLKSDGSND